MNGMFGNASKGHKSEEKHNYLDNIGGFIDGRKNIIHKNLMVKYFQSKKIKVIQKKKTSDRHKNKLIRFKSISHYRI